MYVVCCMLILPFVSSEFCVGMIGWLKIFQDMCSMCEWLVVPLVSSEFWVRFCCWFARLLITNYTGQVFNSTKGLANFLILMGILFGLNNDDVGLKRASNLYASACKLCQLPFVPTDWQDVG